MPGYIGCMISKEELTARVDDGFDSELQFLTELVAIPSVSSDPSKREEMIRSAQFVKDTFEGLGLEAAIHSAATDDGQPGRPAIIARSEHDPSRPTVLLYAHHDVQPPGDASRWASDPFVAEVRGDRIYGRGTSDDGAGIAVHVGALRAFDGRLPVNVVVFVEGEEEVGSPSFANFLEKYREQLKADVIIVADSGNWTTEIPAITSSLRGVSTVDVTVRVLDHAVHSGMFGGPVLDAVTLAARLISTLHDADGNVAVKGLGGNPKAEVQWAEADYRRDASVVDGYRLAGTADLAARVWTMPAISVIGVDATSVADSANAIIPQCKIRLSLRTVPGTSTAESAAALCEHLVQNAPFGAQVEVSIEEEGPAYTADLHSAEAAMLRNALSEAFQNPAVAIGQGGSIPFIAEFERVFPDATVLVTGVEDPATNAHSEDESQSLPVLRNATLAEALLLRELGRKDH